MYYKAYAVEKAYKAYAVEKKCIVNFSIFFMFLLQRDFVSYQNYQKTFSPFFFVGVKP